MYAYAADGTRIATYEYGNPQGYELVLVHGFCQTHLAFKHQFGGALAERCRIIALDLRGHGASDKPEGVGSYQSDDIWAKDLASVIRSKALRRPTLVGWSMGGRVVREYTRATADAQIAGISFVSSQVIQDPRCRGPASPKNFTPEYSLQGEIDWTIDFLQNCYHVLPSEAEFRVALAYNMTIPDRVRRAIAGWTSDPLAAIARFQNLDVPVMLSHGRQDRVVLPIATELAAKSLHSPRISWYDECGHSPFAEYPVRFNQELMQFVEECNGTGRS